MNYLDATRVEGAPESRLAVERCSESPGSARRLEAFAFDIGDKVTISEVGRPGRVEALMIDFWGHNIAWPTGIMVNGKSSGFELTNSIRNDLLAERDQLAAALNQTTGEQS